jgi:hypothetical protein
MLRDAYGAAEVQNTGNYLRYPEKTRRKLIHGRWTGTWSTKRVVVGHIPYGLYRRSLPRDARYVTFLREPIDRVLSHYHRHVERKSRTTETLEEALEMGPPDLTNLATRFLCGHTSPLGELPPSALDDAKANLRRFEFVGLQERLEESIVLLQRMLGLGLVPYMDAHVSVDRPAVGDIPDEQRALIGEFNRLDVELYTFGLGLFEQALARSDEQFAADVEALRVATGEANAAAFRTARDWLDRELPVGAARPTEALYAAAEAAGISHHALKHVLERSSVSKVKDRDGR